MNRNLVLIAFALMFWGIGEGMFFNFIPIYLGNQFHLGEQQIGIILGVFGFFMAVTHIPSGHLADRFGRRPLLISAWLTGFASTLIMSLATGLPLYLIGIFSYGLTTFVMSPLYSYVTAARGTWSIGLALSLTTAAFSTGMALGPVTGGWIGETFGMRSSYMFASAVFLVSMLFILFIQKQPVDRHDPSAPPTNLWNNRRFRSFLSVVAFSVFAMYLAQPLTPNFLEGVRNLSLSETGWVFSAGALGNAVLAVSIGRFNPRVGFLFGQALVGVFAVCIWKGSALPVFMLGYFLLGGFRAARPMFMALARDLVHDSQMGLAYGTMETVGSIIYVIVPPIAGFLFEIDPIIVYPITIGLIIFSIIISFIFSPGVVNHA